MIYRKVKKQDKEVNSWIVRRDGLTLRKVCRDWRASWVGKTDTLAFEQNGKICLARAPDFQPRMLTRMPTKRHNDSIAYLVSPDSKQIAFTRCSICWNHDRTELTRGTGVLWVQNADGTHRRKLYDSHGSWQRLPVLAGWSPDSHYVFMGDWVYHAGSANLDGTPLYLFNTHTYVRRSLAPSLVMKQSDWYAYAPDGRKIVVVDGGARFGMNPKTLLVEEVGSWRRHRLTTPSMDSLFPAWSPDGKRLAYIANNELRYGAPHEDAGFSYSRLCVMEVASGHKMCLTGQDGYGDWNPMRCANGHNILFLRLDRSNRASFWLIQDDGRNLRQLVDGPKFPGNGTWTEYYDFWTPRRGWNHR